MQMVIWIESKESLYLLEILVPHHQNVVQLEIFLTLEVEKQKVPTVIKRKEIPLPQLGGKNGIYYVKNQ